MDLDERARAKLDAMIAALEQARAIDNRLKTPATAAARAKALVEVRLATTAMLELQRREFGL